MKLYIVFKDSKKTQISAVFYSPQDKTVYPDIEEIDDDDERYIALESSSKNPFISYLAVEAIQYRRILY